MHPGGLERLLLRRLLIAVSSRCSPAWGFSDRMNLASVDYF